MQARRPAAGSVCWWRQVVVLSLCVWLPASCSMRTARDRVIPPVSAAETGRLRDLLGGKRIDASFADGSRLRGRVKEVQDGLLTVNVNKSDGLNAPPPGLQEIPTERLLTIQFTQYKGWSKRALFGTVFALGGAALGLMIVASEWSGEGIDGTDTWTCYGTPVGMGALGYLWGKKKDKQNVILVIQQPEASGDP